MKFILLQIYIQLIVEKKLANLANYAYGHKIIYSTHQVSIFRSIVLRYFFVSEIYDHRSALDIIEP